MTSPTCVSSKTPAAGDAAAGKPAEVFVHVDAQAKYYHRDKCAAWEGSEKAVAGAGGLEALAVHSLQAPDPEAAREVTACAPVVQAREPVEDRRPRLRR